MTFDNAQGEALAARLDVPPDGRPRACAIFAHCFTCSKTLSAVSHISRALVNEGIAVLRFDFTGLGESEGDFADTTFSSNVADLLAAAAFLEREHQAPALLVGHSLGGAAVLCAAAHLPSVRAVVTIGAPFDPAHIRHLFADGIDEIAAQGEATVDLGGRPFVIKQEFLDDLSEAGSRDHIAHLGKALLVMHAPADKTVSIDNARRIFEAARHPKSFVSLDAADHLLTEPADARYAGRVLAAWADAYIGAAEHPSRAAQPHPDFTGEPGFVVTRTEQAGFRTDVIASGHRFAADEPTSVGGEDTGPTPYDLVVAGLGACTGMTLQMYARRKKWPLESVTVRLRHDKLHADDCEDCETRGPKLDQITRDLTLTGPLDAAQRERLLEIADRCPVHRTLTSHIDVVTHLRPPDANV